MKNKIYKLFFSILFLSAIYFLEITKVNAHTDWSILHAPHEPKVCKPNSERTLAEKTICKDDLKRHRLCLLDEFCAIEKLEKLQKELDAAKAMIKQGGSISCKDVNFAHVVLDNANIYKETSGNSKVIQKVKKGQKISFVGSTEKKGWIIVIPKTKSCKIGYINESYIGLSTNSEITKKNTPKLKSNIEITFPKWTQKGKLITLDQSGFFEIDGYVNKDLGINKVIINYDGNDEEMILGSDGSFNASLQIENTLDVRITSYKGKKQIGKVLTFKIEVE